MAKHSSVILSILFLLTVACGGGSDVIVDPPPPANYTINIAGPSDGVALVGESVGLVLQVPESNISNISWRQTSGTNLSFLGANRKVIGFDVPQTGSYSFSVSFLDSAGGNRSATYTFTANDESPVYLNARLDHEANSQAKMSLYAYENLPGNLTSVSWSQVSGPQATLETTDQLELFFDAPVVTSDSLLQFEVSASDDMGNTATDIINILLEPETIHPDSHFNSGRFAANSLADVYAYNRSSPYADALEKCVYSNTTTEYCTLGELPFLGSVNPTPTIDQVMDRLLVTHDWMGERFRTFLEQIDVNNDIKNLLGATTSIVVSYDIRPSFFWSGTGAIYIDARYFWVTPEERDTLNGAPDFRSDFDKDLQFRDPWRIVKDNDYAFSIPSRESRLERSLDDSRFFALRLLYHELAHANDFFPPRVWADASDSDVTFSWVNANGPDSDDFSAAFVLNSDEMYDLGGVMFAGNQATQTQMNYTPADVSGFFFPYEATNTYNYSTPREDYAMLAEEYLMGYRHGVQYDQGISGLAPDYIISTAERGRVGHQHIKPRAEWVISRILPSINLQEASASLPAPVQLTSGISWWDSIVAPGQTAKVFDSNKAAKRPRILFSTDIHPEN